MEKKKRYFLAEEDIPRYWYNIQADMVNKPATQSGYQAAVETGRPVSDFCGRTEPSGTEPDGRVDRDS